MKEILFLFIFMLTSCGKGGETYVHTTTTHTSSGVTEITTNIEDGEKDAQTATSTHATLVPKDKFGNSLAVSNVGEEEFTFDSIEDMNNFDIITLTGGKSFSNEKIKIEIRGLRELDIAQYYPGNKCVKLVRDGLLQDELNGQGISLKNYQDGTADFYIQGRNLLDILKEKGAINRGDGKVAKYYSICDIE